MRTWSPQQKQLIKALLLGVVLVGALLMAAIPHRDYRYPVHSDEWAHYGYTESLMETTTLSYPDPFEAGRILSPDIETGFHVLIGEIKHFTGTSGIDLFRFLPGLILAILAFLVYTMTGRGWIGLISAFFTVLMPTTIRFLGPAFLAPVALGLTFIPLTLLILREFMHDPRGHLLLALALFSLLFIHPPTFIVVSLTAVVHLVFYVLPGKGLESKRRLAVISLCCVAAVYVFGFFWASSFISFNINEALTPDSEISLPPILNIVGRFGYVLPFLFAAGTGILAYRGTRENRALVVSAIGLLVFQLIYAYVFLGPDIIYERGWLYLYVSMAIISGLAVGESWQRLQGNTNRLSVPAAVVSYSVIILLLTTSFVFSLRNHLNEPFYRLVDERSYADFLWVKENVPPVYQSGIADLGVNGPFAAVTGKYVYIGEVSQNFRYKWSQADEFFDNGARDYQWLIGEGLSMVYTNSPVENNRLNKVHHNQYLLTGGPGAR